MSSLTSMFNSALSFSMDMQNIQDSLPERAKGALSGIKSGTTYLCEEVNSKIGERRTFKTPQGVREMIELGPIGDSANIIKVRCCATGMEFIMKRLEMININTASKTEQGNPGLVSVEAMEALALRADLVPSLPENPNLVRCYCSQADNTGLTPAKVLLFELCGESLVDVMAQGPVKPDEILHILRDVAGGLFSLHSVETGPVVHGSVEPAHILRDTKSDVWKLGSFGAAHSSMEDDPEDAASDIWQLGILLLTLLFGATAFDKKSQIGTMNPVEVRNTMVASITAERPTNSMEGRILLLATWLLAADPSRRPTAEQVVIAAGSLGVLPAPQLALACPADVRKDFKTLCMALVRRTIFEAINAIEGSDRRILINKYGEEALRNPHNLPNSVKQGALSTQQSNYIRILSSFLPANEKESSMTQEATKLRQELAALAANHESTSKATSDSPTAQAPVDLLDFGEPSATPQESSVPPKVQQTTDLMGFEEPAPTTDEEVPQLIPQLIPAQEVPQLIPAPGTDLLSIEPASSTATMSAPQVGGLDLFDVAAPTQEPKSSELDLFSAPAAPQQTKTSDLDCLQSKLGDLFNAPTTQQVPTPMMPAAPATGGYAQANPFDMPTAQPVVQQTNTFSPPAAQQQGPIIGMQQVVPPKKEEPKDPFAGLAGF